jgi:hypothetical protein
VDDAELVLDAARDDELVGVDDDADPAAIVAEAEVEDRQAALDGDRDADGVVQFEAADGGELLLGEELLGQPPQAQSLVAVETGEKAVAS